MFLFFGAGYKIQLKKLFFLVAVVLCVFGFIGCSSDSGNSSLSVIPIPNDLIGTWESPPPYGEIYIITENTYTSGPAADPSYIGDIVKVKSDGPGAGYIIIQFTEHNGEYKKDGAVFSAVGRYYVIHYQSLTSGSVEISGAYSASDPDTLVITADFSDWGIYDSPSGGSAGKTTEAIAESMYTVENGYFGMHSACTLTI